MLRGAQPHVPAPVQRLQLFEHTLEVAVQVRNRAIVEADQVRHVLVAQGRDRFAPSLYHGRGALRCQVSLITGDVLLAEGRRWVEGPMGVVVVNEKKERFLFGKQL